MVHNNSVKKSTYRSLTDADGCYPFAKNIDSSSRFIGVDGSLWIFFKTAIVR